MIKVLYVHSSLGLGGAQSVRYMFLKHLDSKLFDIRICCLGQKGEFGRKIEELGYRVDTFNKGDGLFCFLTTLKLYRYLKKNDFNIIHSSLFYANYHAALASIFVRAPFLVTEEHGEHNLHWKKRYFVYRIIGRWIAKRSKLIICCSDFVKEGVQKMYYVSDKNVLVLKNLVEDKRVEIKRSREAVRAELNIPFDALVAGTVSSLYWVKNQKILIDIVSQSDKDKLFLVIAGDGPLKNELIEYAQKKGVISKVRFLGWRKDVPDILNALDVFMLPSISEGLPICLLEAMSIGLPCIASRVGGVEEVLKDGETGITVSANNIDDFPQALKRIINNRELGLKLGSAARSYVMDYFQPVHYVNKVIDRYRELIK